MRRTWNGAWIGSGALSTSSAAIFDLDARKAEPTALEARMSEPGFWDRPEDAKQTAAALKAARRVLTAFEGPALAYSDLRDLFDLTRTEDGAATHAAAVAELAPPQRTPHA